MEKYKYQVIMYRIQKIEQDQLSCLDYVCDKIDFMVDVQKENVWERMMQLGEEKDKLIEYIK